MSPVVLFIDAGSGALRRSFRTMGIDASVEHVWMVFEPALEILDNYLASNMAATPIQRGPWGQDRAFNRHTRNGKTRGLIEIPDNEVRVGAVGANAVQTYPASTPCGGRPRHVYHNT